jgi:hypothetical protein
VKLPAVAIAAAFCCGIALGLWTPVAKFGTTSSALTYGFILAFSLIVAKKTLMVIQVPHCWSVCRMPEFPFTAPTGMVPCTS